MNRTGGFPAQTHAFSPPQDAFFYACRLDGISRYNPGAADQWNGARSRIAGAVKTQIHTYEYETRPLGARPRPSQALPIPKGEFRVSRPLATVHPTVTSNSPLVASFPTAEGPRPEGKQQPRHPTPNTTLRHPMRRRWE